MCISGANNTTIEETTGRYVLKPNNKNVPNAILEIKEVELSDRGHYKCIGSNIVDSSNATTFIRVKGSLTVTFFQLCKIVVVFFYHCLEFGYRDSSKEFRVIKKVLLKYNHYIGYVTKIT